MTTLTTTSPVTEPVAPADIAEMTEMEIELEMAELPPAIAADPASLILQPLGERALFWRPAYLAQSAWLEHIPFAFWLAEAHRPAVFVELGVHLGTSYFAFCQAFQRLGLDTRCFGIDTFKGDDHAGYYGDTVLEQVTRHNASQYSGFSRLVRSSFDDALAHFADGEIDLLHIDGLHTLDAVRRDFEAWLPKLSRRAVVIMHDTNVRERDFGVHRLFGELRQSYPHFEFLHGHGLGVLGVGRDQTPALRRLFSLSPRAGAGQPVRELFSRLGQGCADAYAAAAAKESAPPRKESAAAHGTTVLPEALRQELGACQDRLEETREAMRRQAEQGAVERGRSSARAEMLQARIDELKQELEHSQGAVDALSAELADTVRELTEAIGRADTLALRAATAEEGLADMEKSAAEMGRNLDLAQARSAETVAELQTELASERRALAAEKKRTQRTLARRDATVAELRAAARRDATGHSEEQAALRNEIARLEAERQEQAENTERLSAELASVAEPLQQAQARQRAADDARLSAERRVSALEGELKAASVVLEAAEAKHAQDCARAAQQHAELQAKLRAEHQTELKAQAEVLRAAEKRLAESESRSAALLAAKEESDAAHAKLQAERNALADEKQAQAVRLEERYAELAALTRLIEERDRELAKLAEAGASIAATVAAPAPHAEPTAAPAARPAGKVPRTVARGGKPGFSVEAQVMLIEQSGLFDRNWYLRQYPDVAHSGADPVEHFVLRGAAEGRNPSASFDTRWYLAQYKDAAAAGINPLLHYVRAGMKDGRATAGAAVRQGRA